MADVAQGIAHARYAATDLGRRETLLRDFSLTRVLRTEWVLYLRGIGADLSPLLGIVFGPHDPKVRVVERMKLIDFHRGLAATEMG